MTDSTLMTPADVLKLIKRARAKGPVSFGCHVGIDMPTADGTYYPNRALVMLTMGQATRMLNDLQRFHDVKVAKGDKAPMLSVSEPVSEFDPRHRFIYWG